MFYTYCRCVGDITALRGKATRYINSSPGDPHIGEIISPPPKTEGQTDFLNLQYFCFFAMNTVYKTRPLSSHFIYYNIYTNNSRSN